MSSRVLIFLYFFSLYFSGGGFIYVYYISFVSCFAYVVLIIAKQGRIGMSSSLRAFFLFCAFSGLSITWAVNQSFAVEMLARLTLFTFNIVVVQELLRNAREAAFYGSCGLVAAMLFQVLLIPIDVAYHSGRFTGTTINSNHLSILCTLTYASILAVFGVRKIRFWKLSSSATVFISSIILAASSITVVLLTESRKGALILVLLFLSHITLLAYKRLDLSRAAVFLGLSSFLVFLVIQIPLSAWPSLDVFQRFQGSFIGFRDVNVFDFDKDSFDGDGSTKFRLYFISLALQEFLENPFLGRGLDNFRGIYNDKLYSHSNLFELLSTLGIVGTILYYNFAWSVFKQIVLARLFVSYILVFLFIFNELFMVSYFERFYIMPLILISAIFSLKNNLLRSKIMTHNQNTKVAETQMADMNSSPH